MIRLAASRSVVEEARRSLGLQAGSAEMLDNLEIRQVPGTTFFLGRYTAINGAAQRIRLSPAVRHALGYVLGAAPAQRLIRRLMVVAIPRLPRMLPTPEPWMRRWAEYALSGERHE